MKNSAMKTNHLALLFFLLLWPLARVNAQMKPVDLGLSVKWASCNLGASKPHEFGAYYAWGEVEPKTEYAWETNRYCSYGSTTYASDGYKKVTKYCTDNKRGMVDGKTRLETMDDPAQVATDGQWRMPTWEERDELIKNCEWKWKEQKGVKGYEVTSKKNGNSIFLPAAGYMKSIYCLRSGLLGFYWFSSLWLENPLQASYLGFSEKRIQPDLSYQYYEGGSPVIYREYGFSIRPVQQ